MNEDDKLRIYEWAKRDKWKIENMIFYALVSILATILATLIILDLTQQ